MTDYYQERKAAWEELELMLKSKKGIETDYVMYQLTKKYAIGKQVLLDRLGEMFRLKLIEETPQGYKWIGLKNGKDR